jgi:signal transduction histidine kinase
MLKSIHEQSKQQVLLVAVLITVIFLTINGALLLINRNALTQKIEEENLAFVTIASHIIDDNPLTVAEEYILHYTHIHEVEIRVSDETNTIIFDNTSELDNPLTYTINTTKGSFYFTIDNTNSVTVQLNELNLIIINSILLIIYVVAMIGFIKINKRHTKNVNRDLKHVLSLIDEDRLDYNFVYKEFYHIHQSIKYYLESIDLLHEQKEMLLKGLAHDIKTPLTILYHYFSHLKKEKPLTKEEVTQSFEAAKQINDYIERMVSDQQEQKVSTLKLNQIISKKIEDYQPILNQKSIQVKTQFQESISVRFVEQDFNRILDNLFSNAYYYSKEGSVLQLNLIQDERIKLEIISEPINVDVIDISRLFIKGYRAGFVDNPHGKGLGLYLTKLLIEHQSGKIYAAIEKKYMKITILL